MPERLGLSEDLVQERLQGVHVDVRLAVGARLEVIGTGGGVQARHALELQSAASAAQRPMIQPHEGDDSLCELLFGALLGSPRELRVTKQRDDLPAQSLPFAVAS